jgi:hypothetical protein
MKEATSEHSECSRVATLGTWKRNTRPWEPAAVASKPYRRRAVHDEWRCDIKVAAGRYRGDARKSSWLAGGEGNGAGRTNLLTIL